MVVPPICMADRDAEFLGSRSPTPRPTKVVPFIALNPVFEPVLLGEEVDFADGFALGCAEGVGWKEVGFVIWRSVGCVATVDGVGI